MSRPVRRDSAPRGSRSPKSDEGDLRVRHDACCCPATDARMQDDDGTAEHDRKQGKHARGERADTVAGTGHDGDDDGGRQRPQRNVERAAQESRRRPAGSIAPAQRNGDGKHHGVERHGAERRPGDETQRGSDREPDHHRNAEAYEQTVALRQHGVGGGEDRDCGANRDTAHRTRGDEARRVLDGEDDVGRAGCGRQGGDQRADERAAALDRHRGDHDNRRRHRHLQGEPVPEHKFRGHIHSSGDLSEGVN